MKSIPPPPAANWLRSAAIFALAIAGCATTKPPGAPPLASHPFANSTLCYESHMADWAIYLGESSSGSAPYVGQQFEGRGGARASGSYDYRVKQTPDGTWLIELRAPVAEQNLTVIVLPNYTKDPSGAIKGTGNIMQSNGQALWPGEMNAMTFSFLPGRHLAGARPASGS